MKTIILSLFLCSFIINVKVRSKVSKKWNLKRWFEILCDYSEVYPNNRAPPETPILTWFYRSANILNV